jgi:hypothetical protein
LPTHSPTNDDAFVYTGVLRPRHLSPDLLRWEQHRVWVVEATLKPGQNHVYRRRVLDTGAYTEVHYGEPMPERLWSPDSMAGTGVR